MINIAVVLMVKNESARIEFTIKSCNHPSISGLVIYDTGSTDNTIEVIKSTAKSLKNIKHVDIIQGEFQDFATSRNINLDFAQECAVKHGYNLFFLLDSNDELIFENNFDPAKLVKSDAAVWLVNCEWKIRNDESPMIFRNTKLVKANVPELRWIGVVHEYLTPGSHKRELCDSVKVVQDRIKDNDGKTRERWLRDRILLEKEVENNPGDLRSLFYLAQTYACIGENKLAYEHYEKRSLINDGFYEEQYCSLYRCGELARILSLPDEIAISWFTKAFIHSERAEPLVSIAEIYEKSRNYKLAYIFVNMACKLKYPENMLLFVDKNCYEYKRWHLLGRIAWYASKNTLDESQIMKDGYTGCKMAIASKDLDVDKNNMTFYKDSL